MIIGLVLLGFWGITSAKELYLLMKKYPTAFQQSNEFSFIRFYNTYKTISFSDAMVQSGHTSSYYCTYVDFKDEAEKKRLQPLVKAEYSKLLPNHNYVDDTNRFMPVGASNCTANSKLINFEFKCNEAYATFACESGDYVSEFTYTDNGGGKCGVIDYKKSWGVEPRRTVQYTKSYLLLDASDSIFDSSECEPR